MLHEHANTVLDPTWLNIMERIGLPIFIVLFICAVVWKLLPYIIEWFKQGTASAQIVAEAIPDMKESLHRMANATVIGEQKLQAIDARTVEIEKNTERILSKLP